MSDTHNIITEQVEHNIVDEIIEHSLSEEVIEHIIEAEQGPPGPAGADGQGANPGDFAYPHNQAVALAEWLVNHNLGFLPNVQVFDSAGDSVIPMKIIHDSTTSLRIQFLGAMAGSAVLS